MEDNIILDLPNGSQIAVPRDAVEKDVREYANYTGAMTSEEWGSYDTINDSIQAAKGYIGVDANPLLNPVQKYVAKKAIEYNVDPKRAAEILPLAAPLMTTIAAAPLLAAAGTGAIITALGLGVAGGIGGFAGEAGKDVLQGKEVDYGKAAETGGEEFAIETGLGLFSPAIAKTYSFFNRNKSIFNIDPEVLDDAFEISVTEELHRKLSDRGTGLLPDQVEGSSWFLRSAQRIANFGYGSDVKIANQVVKQEKYLEEQVTELYRNLPEKADRVDAGRAVVSLVEATRKASREFFTEAYGGLVDTFKAVPVDSKGAKAYAAALKKKLFSGSRAIDPVILEAKKELEDSVASLNRKIDVLESSSTPLKANNSRKIQEAKRELAAKTTELADFKEKNRIPFAQMQLVKVLDDFQGISDETNLQDMYGIVKRLKGYINDIKVENGDVQPSYFPALLDAQAKLEGVLLKQGGKEFAEQYKNLNKLYGENSEVIYSGVINSFIRQGEPEKIVDVMAANGSITPFRQLQEVFNRSKQFIEDPATLRQLDADMKLINETVSANLLSLGVPQGTSTVLNTLKDFQDKLGDIKFRESFSEVIDKGTKRRVDLLLKEFEILSKNDVASSAMSLSVPANQVAGAKAAMKPEGNFDWLVGIMKALTPAVSAKIVTDSKRTAILLSSLKNLVANPQKAGAARASSVNMQSITAISGLLSRIADEEERALQGKERLKQAASDLEQLKRQ